MHFDPNPVVLVPLTVGPTVPTPVKPVFAWPVSDAPEEDVCRVCAAPVDVPSFNPALDVPNWSPPVGTAVEVPNFSPPDAADVPN